MDAVDVLDALARLSAVIMHGAPQARAGDDHHAVLASRRIRTREGGADGCTERRRLVRVTVSDLSRTAANQA
jgi:hypothetical protein